MSSHEQQWSSATPGLLVILLDQSGSMTEPYSGNDSKAVFATKAVNRMINTIIDKNFDGSAPKNRCFISIIGYGTTVQEVRSDSIVQFAATPIRIDKIKKLVSDGAGGLVEQEFKLPVWVEPIAQGTTDMAAAFQSVIQLVSKWITDKPQNPAPVVINISDGLPTSDMNETISAAKSLMSLNCSDGDVLLFNAHLNKDGANIIFPNSADMLSSDHAKFLFEISSTIPDSYKPAAQKNELKVSDGARGCMFDTDADGLVKLIDFGSSKGQGNDKLS
jgi:uncharacterized protein YegL